MKWVSVLIFCIEINFHFQLVASETHSTSLVARERKAWGDFLGDRNFLSLSETFSDLGTKTFLEMETFIYLNWRQNLSSEFGDKKVFRCGCPRFPSSRKTHSFARRWEERTRFGSISRGSKMGVYLIRNGCKYYLLDIWDKGLVNLTLLLFRWCEVWHGIRMWQSQRYVSMFQIQIKI